MEQNSAIIFPPVMEGAKVIINKIEISDFKSLAKDVCFGPFSPEFSAIFSFNERVQRDILESMLFVIGYRNQNTLPIIISELIHDSPQRPNVNSCKVAVHLHQVFDKKDDIYEFIPNTEIVIARTGFKDNTSFHSINGQETSFEDVVKILAVYDIDLLQYRCLILREEVESIKVMKPITFTTDDKSLLKYLEESICEESNRKNFSQIDERLKNLNKDQEEKENECRLAETDLKNLEKTMKRAVEYQKLSNIYNQTKNLHRQVGVYQTKEKIAHFEVTLTEFVRALKVTNIKSHEFMKSHSESEKSLETSLKEHRELSASVKNHTTAQKEALTSCNRIDCEMNRTEDHLVDLNQQALIKSKKIEAWQSSLEQTKEVVRNNQDELSRKIAEVKKLEKKLAENLKIVEFDDETLFELRKDLEDLKVSYSKAEKELESPACVTPGTNSQKLGKLRRTLSVETIKLHEKKRLLQAAGQSMPNMKKQLSENEEKVKHLQETERSVLEQLQNIPSQEAQEQLTNIQNQVQNLRIQNDELTLNICQKEQEFNQLKDAIKAKENDIEELQSIITSYCDKIRSITDTKLKSKIEQLNREINNSSEGNRELTAKISATLANLEAAEKCSKEIANKRIEAEKLMEVLAKEREQFKADGERCAVDIEQLNQRIDELTITQAKIEKKIELLLKEQGETIVTETELIKNYKIVMAKKEELLLEIATYEEVLVCFYDIPNEKKVENPFETFTDDKLRNENIDKIQCELKKMEEELKDKKPNLFAIGEFYEKQKYYLEIKKAFQDVTAKKNRTLKDFEIIQEKRLIEFTEGIQIINQDLQEIFSMVVPGGEAKLELVDSENPFIGGIILSVRPPSCNWKDLKDLSNGEKTLSSLALVFALRCFNPSPFYFMDEIDAGLDFKNALNVGNFINKQSANSQVIISTRDIKLSLSSRTFFTYHDDVEFSKSFTRMNLN